MLQRKIFYLPSTPFFFQYKVLLTDKHIFFVDSALAQLGTLQNIDSQEMASSGLGFQGSGFRVYSSRLRVYG